MAYSVLVAHHRPLVRPAGRREIPAFAEAMLWFTLDHLDRAWAGGPPSRAGTALTHRKNHRKRVDGLRRITAVPLDQDWGMGRLAYAWAPADRRRDPVVSRHGLDVRTVAVELLLGQVLPCGAAVHVLDAGLVPMRQHLAHADPGFEFPWPDIVAVRPEGAFSLVGGLDWSRGPWAAIVVDSGQSPVDLVRRVEGLRAWWPIIAVITARPQVAGSHPVFDGVAMIPAPPAMLRP